MSSSIHPIDRKSQTPPDTEIIKLRVILQSHIVTAWGWEWAWGEHCTFIGPRACKFLCIKLCRCHWLLRKGCNWFAGTTMQAENTNLLMQVFEKLCLVALIRTYVWLRNLIYRKSSEGNYGWTSYKLLYQMFSLKLW